MATRNLFGDNPFNSRRAGFILGGGGNSQEEDDPLLAAIRKQGLFQRPGVQPMNSSAVTQRDVEPKVDPFAQALERIKGGQASSAYREHIGKMPEREAYAPSQGRRLGAALVAGAASFNDPKRGAELGEQITEAPYRNALDSWSMKGAGLKEQADIESQDVKGQIEWVKRMQDQQRADAVERRDVRRLELDEERARTDKMYRQAQIEKYQTEGWTKDVDAQGNTIMIKMTPQGPQQMNLGPSMEGRRMENTERGTNIAAGHLGVAQGNLGVAQGNLGMRGNEFNYRMGQDAITNAQNDQRIGISQQSANQAGMNAGSAGYVGAGEQLDARGVAGRNVMAAHPEWANWFDETGLLKPNSAFWTDQASNPDYAKAAQAVKDEIDKVMGVRRPGVGAPPGGMGRPAPIRLGDLPPGGATPPPRPFKF